MNRATSLMALLALLSAGPLGCDPEADDDSTVMDDDDDDVTDDDDDDSGDPNQPPAMDPIEDQAVAEGEVLTFDVTASDPDGDDLTIVGVDLPGFAVVEDHADGSATVTLEPGYEDEGGYVLTLQADDGIDAVQAAANVTVHRTPFVTTYAGSPGGAGLADGIGTDAYFYHPYGIAYHEGMIYISDGSGHTIRSYDPITHEVVTISGVPGDKGYADSADGDPQFDYPCGLEMGPDGLLYVADRRNGVIRKVDPVTGEAWTVEDLAGPVTSQEPFDVTFGGNILYFTDLAGCELRWVDLDTLESGVLVGTSHDCRIFDGEFAVARLGEPRGIQYHPDGVLYYTDRLGENVRMVTLDTARVDAVYGSGPTNDYGFVDGVGLDARFRDPTGLTLRGDKLYVADSDNDAIRMIDLTTDMVTTLAGIGENGNVDGPGDQASFSWPIDVIVGADDDDLYVMDPGGHTLRHIDLADPDYTVSTVAGAVSNSGSVDGFGTDVRMSQPRALERGDGDIVWIMDALNSEVRSLDLATTEVVTVAGTAEEWGHLDGIGEDAIFMNPSGGAWMPDGRLFMTETASSTVRVLYEATSEVNTVAGFPSQSGYVDGPGIDARFMFPRDIALGYDGMIYVVDTGNNAIRRMEPYTYEVSSFIARDFPGNPFLGPEAITADGAGTLYVSDYIACVVVAVYIDSQTLEVVAGTSGECDTVDGTGAAARLAGPQGMDYDPATGLLYITEHNGHVVRQFDTVTRELTTFSGDPDLMAPIDGPLDEATYSTPVDVLVVDDYLLVLDRYSAHIRKAELP